MTGTCRRTLFIPPAEPEEKLLTEYEEQSRRSTLFFFFSFFKITTQILSTPLIWEPTSPPFLLPDEDCPQFRDGRTIFVRCLQVSFHLVCVCRIKAYTRKYFSSRTCIYWRCFRNKPRSHFCFFPPLMRNETSLCSFGCWNQPPSLHDKGKGQQTNQLGIQPG